MTINFTWLVERFYNKSPRIRLLISKLIFGNKDLKINLFGTDLEINTLRESGYFRASKLANSSSLIRDEIAILMSILSISRSNDTFVDVGANIGIFSSVISQFSRLNQNVNVYAFEANPSTYERLQKNAKEHDFQSFNVGVSDRECELEFVDGAVSHVFTTVENASAYNLTDKTTKVKCQRLDKFNIVGDSMILKIDVEGQELEVLEGAKAFFDNKRVKAVYLDGFSRQDLVLNFLNNYGFSFFDGKNMSKTDGKIFSLLAVAEEKL
jgi:FkbM family methyltransferase